MKTGLHQIFLQQINKCGKLLQAPGTVFEMNSSKSC